MLEIIFDISDIDYSSIADKIIPLMNDKIEKSGNSTLRQGISKLKLLPASFLKNGIKLLPKDTQNDLAVYMLSSFQEKIIDKINQYAYDESIAITVKNIIIENNKEKGIIELKILIEKIEYHTIAAKVIPMIIEYLYNNNNQSNQLTTQMISILHRVPQELFVDFISQLSQEVKDDIAILLLSANENKIVSYVNRMANEEQIQIEIENITIEQLK